MCSVNNGHWNYPIDIDINNWFGFIYRIVEKSTGKEYIGKKQFWAMRKRSYKGRKNKKITYKESDWKTYTGSSNTLNKQIEENGKDQYLFLIESLHESKGSLYYAEVEKQVKENVLRECLDDGITPKFYNGQISAVRFKPKLPTQNEILHNIDNYKHTILNESVSKINNAEDYYGNDTFSAFKEKISGE